MQKNLYSQKVEYLFKEVIGESLHGNKKIIGKKRRF